VTSGPTIVVEGAAIADTAAKIRDREEAHNKGGRQK